jgi:hypothetical protein
MATVAKPDVRQKSAKDALLESVDRAIDTAAEKMNRGEFKRAAKEFNEVLDRAVSSRRRSRESA